MLYFRFALVSVAIASLCTAQEKNTLAPILAFEAPPVAGTPGGWNISVPGTVFADDKTVHGGHWSVRIERKPGSPGTFSPVTKILPIDFAGKTIELRGFFRTEDVSVYAGLWLREDGDGRTLAIDNMQRQNIHGTTDWTEYSAVLQLNPAATQIAFGFLMAGTGTAWADDLQLLVDGKPVWDAPRIERPQTVLDSDKEFDAGSNISLSELTPVQVANLATLGKVWGFLKYHHPAITSGQRHWDYELFRAMPAVLAATDRTGANAAILKWLTGVGAVDKCVKCAALTEENLYLRSDLKWIADENLLGKDLSKRLQFIHANRGTAEKQFYVSLMKNVENPVFDHELSYPQVKLPDAGYQLLALYRFWNIVEYWAPNRDIVGEDWDSVMTQFIPRIALAKNSLDYQKELLVLIGMAHDTHANLSTGFRVRPPTGQCQLPVTVRFVDNKPVVSGYLGQTAGAESGMKPGDAIEAMNGTPVPQLIAQWLPYYPASNDAARLRDLAQAFTRGDCTETTVRVRRGAESIELKPVRGKPSPPDLRDQYYHDRPGDTLQKLSDKVAYLKLSSAKGADVERYIDQAAGTDGLIIDIRNYPSEFVVFALGSLLVDKDTEFARFTTGDMANPGAFHWRGQPLKVTPGKIQYKGKVVILVDEMTQSQAEYTVMALRASAKAEVVGSMTAGADGNVSQFSLPGGLQTMISGIGVFYPDKRPTQRVGIVPDVEVKPTIEGFRDGRDEVLEAALRRILGAGVPDADIRKLSQH